MSSSKAKAKKMVLDTEAKVLENIKVENSCCLNTFSCPTVFDSLLYSILFSVQKRCCKGNNLAWLQTIYRSVCVFFLSLSLSEDQLHLVKKDLVSC